MNYIEVVYKYQRRIYTSFHHHNKFSWTHRSSMSWTKIWQLSKSCQIYTKLYFIRIYNFSTCI